MSMRLHKISLPYVMLTCVSQYHERGSAVGLSLIAGVMPLNFLVVTLTITLWLPPGTKP